MKEELNEKQKQFCLEYLKDFNATKAYQKVYWWTDNTAWVCWFKLLRNPKIQEYLWSKAQKKIEKAEMWVEYVLEKLQQIIEIWMWEKEVDLWEWKTKRVLDLSNVNSALEKLWKYHKMYTDRVENDWDVVFRVVSYNRPEEWQKL